MWQVYTTQLAKHGLADATVATTSHTGALTSIFSPAHVRVTAETVSASPPCVFPRLVR